MDENIISKELFLELTSTTWFDEICNKGSDGTTNRVRLQKDKFFNQTVLLPEKDEQNEILEKIKAFKKNIELLNNENEIQNNSLSQLRQSILQEAIQGKLTENWRAENPNTEPAEKLLQRIKIEKEKTAKTRAERSRSKGKKSSLPEITESEIPFELPENWVWCRLGEIVQLISGQDLEKSEYNENGKGIPYITGASHFINGELIISRWTEFPKSISCEEDLLITVKGTIGTMAYNKIGEIHIARQIMAIRNIYNIEIDYVKICLENLIVELISKAKSLIPGVSREDILTLKIPLPPLSEQHAIVEQVEKLLGKCTALQTEIENLNKHSKTLLKALFAETFATETV